MLEGFARVNKAIRIEWFERDREQRLGGLESGLIDIAIITGECREPQLARRSQWSERIHVAMPDNHQLADAEVIH